MGSFLLAGVVLSGAAAFPAQAAPTSTVTGHVFLSDTNGPARLATVVLEPSSAIDGYKSEMTEGVSAHMTSVKTLPDGSFIFSRVAPGAYYVFASVPGYVSPLEALGYSREELEKPDKEMKERIANAVPRVLVQANLPATGDVTLERGAAVAGTVLYDDGSPATGLRIKVLVRKKDKWVEPEAEPTHTRPATMTDDRGSFRLSGLPAREYLLEVDLELGRSTIDVGPHGMSMSDSGRTTIPVYGGGVLRQKEATPVKVRLGEERSGENVQIPLGKMHGVSGVITAASDGHAVNSGTVTLLYADDRTEAMRTELTRDDSGFSLSFVPEGDYVVKVSNAADMEYTEVANSPGSWPKTHTDAHAVHSYGPGEQPLHVAGETTGLAVSVPEPAHKSTP